jgi:predicted transcriptional regulator of viral defense system
MRGKMNTVEVLRELPTPLFRTADAAKLVVDGNMFLYRASRSGYLKKICNGVYWNLLFHPEPPKVEQVACFARQPSYITCEWALNYHGLLLQVPRVCTAVTLHPGTGKRNRILYEGYIIEYSRLKETLYLPEEILAQDGILMATAEKALLDAAYLRHEIPFADEMEKDPLDLGRLSRLLPLYPGSVQRKVQHLIPLSFQDGTNPRPVGQLPGC